MTQPIRHFASLSFASLLALIVVSPAAHADQSYASLHQGLAQPKHLPKAEWNVSPLKINIINMNPQVTNNLAPEVSQKYLIPIPSIPAPQQQIIVMPASQVGGSVTTATGGAPVTVPPGYVMIDGSRPPKAKFETNIPPGGVAKNNSLPDGTTTNRLARQNLSGKLTPGQPTFRPVATRLPSRSAPNQPAQVETFTYENNSAGGYASGYRKEKLSVSGKLDRGSLLNAANK